MSSPDELARLVTDLKRRIDKLERANGLQHASVRSGDDSHVAAAPVLVSAQNALLAALTDRVGRAANDGLVTIHYGLDEPDEPYGDGDLWLVSDTELREYDTDAGAWLPITDQALAEALARAQNTADDKTRTYWDDVMPDGTNGPAPEQGDLWFHTTPSIDPTMPPIVVDMWRFEDGVWIQLPMGSMVTPDYSESQTGAKVDANTTQFQNITVLEEVGAKAASFESLEVGGEDLVEEILPTYARVVSMDWSGNRGNTSSVSTGEVKLHEYSYGPILANTLYRVTITGLLIADLPTGNFGSYDLRVRCTTNGTTPGTTSTILPGSHTRAHTFPDDRAGSFIIHFWMNLAADCENLRMALTLEKLYGNNAAIYGNDINRRVEWAIEYCGPRTDSVAGMLAQKTFYTPPAGQPAAPPPDPDPIRTYTRSWMANWTRAYDGDNSSRSGDADRLYQGYISGTHGNTRSLFGFDWEDIRSKTFDSTILSCKLTFRVQYAWGGAGITVRIGTHNYNSEGSSWVGSQVVEGRISRGSSKAGSTYTVDLGAPIGREFKDGVTKGLGFGPGASTSPSTYYGYMYGGTSSSRPKLTITYKK